MGMKRNIEKDKLAIEIGVVIILVVILICVWIADKSYALMVITFLAIALGVGIIGTKLLFVIEKKNVWLHNQRYMMSAATGRKYIIHFVLTFMTVMMVQYLRYIDYGWIVVMGFFVGILTAVMDFLCSKKGLDISETGTNKKTYDEDWWKQSSNYKSGN